MACHIKKQKIAIIGASYAGLALANTLLAEQAKNEHDCWNIVIFESMKGPLPKGTIFNHVRVPFATQLFQHLGLPSPSTETTTNIFSEEDLLDAFRRPVQHLIRYSCTIDHTTKSANGQTNLVIGEGSNPPVQGGDKYVELGPFDVVVAANGVWCNLYIDSGIFVIGDARWASARWWDFGTKRLSEGANQALLDGFELGRHLAYNTYLELNDHGVFFFSAKLKQKGNNLRSFFLVSLLALIVAIRHTTGSEKSRNQEPI